MGLQLSTHLHTYRRGTYNVRQFMGIVRYYVYTVSNWASLGLYEYTSTCVCRSPILSANANFYLIFLNLICYKLLASLLSFLSILTRSITLLSFLKFLLIPINISWGVSLQSNIFEVASYPEQTTLGKESPLSVRRDIRNGDFVSLR
jgi:hypothetical protein